MKKHLISAAVAAAVASPVMAQDVQIYGILSSGYSSIDTSLAVTGATTISRKSKSTGTEGGLSGSRVGFRGTEDLGGGMKAGFVYELGAGLESGLTTNRLGYLDLSGGFGTIRMGRVDGIVRQITNTYLAHGNSGFAPGNIAASYGYLGSATTGVNDADLTAMGWGQAAGRVSNTIGYISPAFSGFSVQAQHGKVESDLSTTANKAVTLDYTGLALRYNTQAFSIMLGNEQSDTATEAATSVETKFDTNSLGASYDFGVAKVFANLTERERKISGSTTTLESKDTSVGVSVPLGNVVLIGSYSDGKLKETASVDTDVEGYQFQAQYNLSKRTRAYAVYGDTEFSTTGVKLSVDGFIIGVQHSF